MDFLVFLGLIFLLLLLVAINIDLYIKYRNRHKNQVNSDILSIEQELEQIETDLNSYSLSENNILKLKKLCPGKAINGNDKSINLIKIRCFGFSCLECIKYMKDNSI